MPSRQDEVVAVVVVCVCATHGTAAVTVSELPLLYVSVAE